MKKIQKKKQKVLSIKCRDNPLGRRHRLMRFNRNRKRNKGRRERKNHKREDVDQSNAIVVEEIIL